MCRIGDIKGNMKDIDVFFFDMGSTVLDFHASKKSDIEMEETGLLKVKKYIEKMYYFIDIKKLNLEVFQPWLEYINTSRKEMLQEKRIDEMIYEYFMKNNILLNRDEINKILKLHYSEFANEVVINDGFIEAASYLKKKDKKLGIISNISYPEKIFIDIFKKLKIYHLFDDYMFSYSNVYMKPHKSMYICPLMKFKVMSKQTIMIGDNYKTDILGAKALGIKTCLYDKRKIAQKREADYYINHFHDIINIYEKEI